MGVSYVAVSWNRQKKIYDLVLAGFCLLYLLFFMGATAIFNPDYTFETLLIRCASTLALLLLHLILCIGPLCRLNKKFLPLLYNRRHLGVTMCCLAAFHGVFSILQFHSQGNVQPLISLLTTPSPAGPVAMVPFQVFGFAALIILVLMAATSHDFWLHNLGPKTWKTLHMMVYVAYFMILIHVMTGVLQYETNPVFIIILAIGSFSLIILHLWAGSKEVKKDHTVTSGQNLNHFVEVCDLEDIQENLAKVISIGPERIAIFRTEGKLYAVSNLCKHQNGPLGEGRIIDGCITCPWHGYQYLPHNGQSPPPFHEKISTYDVRLEHSRVWVNPVPFAEGTTRPGAVIETETPPSKKAGSRDDFFIGWKPLSSKVISGRFQKLILLLCFLASALSVLLAISQKKFSASVFEAGQLTELTGVYSSTPVPCLRIRIDSSAQAFPRWISIPLVGNGKHGAEDIMVDLEKKGHFSLQRKEVTLRGTLLYFDGKTLLQIDPSEHPLVSVSPTGALEGIPRDIAGIQTIQGEIIDPKCYFGVMKPGEGRAHSDCATRCLLGGIPPVFMVKNALGQANYYLILGQNGQPINNELQHFIGIPVTLQAKRKTLDDWIILYVEDPGQIHRVSYLREHFNNTIERCAVNP